MSRRPLRKPLDPDLYADVVAEAKQRFDVWPSAYASGWVVRTYKERGGRYAGGDRKTRAGLTKWFGEEWVDLSRPIHDEDGQLVGYEPCGRRASDDPAAYPKCRPLKEAMRMSPDEVKDAIRRKRMAEAKAALGGRGGRGARAPVRVATYRKNPRPVRLNKEMLAWFVTESLVPQVVKSLERLAARGSGDEPLGHMTGFAHDYITILGPDRSSIHVEVVVKSRPSKAKYTAVLEGSAGRREPSRSGSSVEVYLFLNGALTPNDFLMSPEGSSLGGLSFKNDRLQPLEECTSSTCLPYGLYSILLHEMTHAAEAGIVAVDGAGWGKSNRGTALREGETVVVDRREYVNDPLEVRAFMQQVVDEVLKYVDKSELEFLPIRQRLDVALQLSTTWKLVKDDLTQRNRARILKAVHTVLQDKGYLP